MENDEQHETEATSETEAPSQTTSHIVPQVNSSPISVAANSDNTNVASQSQTQSEAPSSSGPTLTANIKGEPNTEHSFRSGNDSDVICLGEKPEEIFDLCSDDSLSTQELFLQCNNIANTTSDSPTRENLITVHTQPSPAVSTKINIYM